MNRPAVLEGHPVPHARSRRASVDVRAAIESLQRSAVLPAGAGERFAGFSALGIAFASGDVLAVHGIVASSLGPPFAAVWHRAPSGAWRFYADVEPERSLARFTTVDAAHAVTTFVVLGWPGAETLRVSVPSAGIDATLRLTESPLTRILAEVRGSDASPRRFSRGALRLLGWGARVLLGAGRVTLAGRTPTGHRIAVHPQHVWSVADVSATIEGRSLGRMTSTRPQVPLGSIWLPMRPLLVVTAFAVHPP